MKVRYTPQAQGDLEQIFTYLDERSAAGARSVKAQIVSAIARLSSYPLMAPETDEPGVRELTILKHPYKVYYQISENEIWVLHIRHAARRPWQAAPAQS